MIYAVPGVIKSRRKKWTGNVVRVRERGGEWMVFVGKHEGKDSIKMGRGVGGGGWWWRGWVHIVHDRDSWRTLVNAVWTFGFHEMEAISRLVKDCQLLKKESAFCIYLFLYCMFDLLDSRLLYAVNKWCKCVITLNVLCLRRFHVQAKWTELMTRLRIYTKCLYSNDLNVLM